MRIYLYALCLFLATSTLLYAVEDRRAEIYEADQILNKALESKEANKKDLLSQATTELLQGVVL